MDSVGLADSSFLAPTLSMADDRMEMSSDHGGFSAADDIDIDIDITDGPADEDYMIQDPNPEYDMDFKETDVEFKESYEPVPQAINDDVMVDDYTSSYKAEEVHDEELQDVPDEISDVPDMGISDYQAPETNGSDLLVGNHDTEELSFDTSHHLSDNPVENISADVIRRISQAEPSHTENALEDLTSEAMPNTDAESGVANDTNALPDSSDDLANDSKINSPSKNELVPEDAKELSIVDDENDNLVEALAEAVDTSNRSDVGKVEDNLDTADKLVQEQWIEEDMDQKYSAIMVRYQDTHYALFSSHEDEDSDSFFLKDRYITQEPISLFLKALRDILKEEVDDDEELCIAIDVLNLEFGEKSAEIDNVTFEELVHLHQKLLRNDGIHSPGPMNFTLGTRPEFAKRFVGLLAGASEGKGLSELVPRDGESGSYDDAETSLHPGEEYDEDTNQDGAENEALDEAYIDVQDEIQDESQNEAHDEVSEEIQDEVPEENPEEFQDEVPEENSEEIQDGVPNEIQDETPDEIQDNVPEEVQDQITGEIQDEVRDEIPDKVQAKISDEVQAQIPAEIPDEIQDEFPGDIQDGSQDNIHDAIQDEYTLGDELEQVDDAASTFLETSEDQVDNNANHNILNATEELDGYSKDAGDADEKDQDDQIFVANSTNPAPARDVIASESVQSGQHYKATTEKVQHRDEDDLIDYSEEEDFDDDAKPRSLTPSSRNGNNRDFVLPCLKPNTCFCAACNEILLANYEAYNEELRRRSVSSRKAENSPAVDAILNAASKTGNTTENNDQKPAVDVYDTDEIDFDLDEDIGDSSNVPHESHEEGEGDGELEPNPDESDKFGDYYGFDEHQSLEDDQDFDFGDDIANENDVVIQDFTAKAKDLKVLISTARDPASVKSNSTSPNEEISAESVTVSGDSVDEIDYEDDLPSTVPRKPVLPNTHSHQQAAKSPNAEEIDEIDYDDVDEDDRNVVTPQSQNDAALQTTSSSTPVKRRRSESVSEAASGEGSPEAKRVRS